MTFAHVAIKNTVCFVIVGFLTYILELAIATYIAKQHGVETT